MEQTSAADNILYGNTEPRGVIEISPRQRMLLVALNDFHNVWSRNNKLDFWWRGAAVVEKAQELSNEDLKMTVREGVAELVILRDHRLVFEETNESSPMWSGWGLTPEGLEVVEALSD